MYHIVFDDFANKIAEKEPIYDMVLKARVSQNCICAAEDYFQMIEPLCLQNPAIVSDLLRIAIRPLFYLGITQEQDLLDSIYGINKERKAFLCWLKRNENLIFKSLIQLKTLCFFYELSYDKNLDKVILNHKIEEEMAYVFGKKDRNIYKIFESFKEFKCFFSSFFEEVSEDELDRMILEEKYQDIFQQIKAKSFFI